MAIYTKGCAEYRRSLGRSNNLAKIELKTRQNRITTEDRRIIDDFRHPIWSVYMSAIFKWVEQPSKLDTISNVLFHLFLNGPDPIGRRPKLDHEIRTEAGQLLLLVVLNPIPTLPSNPGRVGPTLCGVGKVKPVSVPKQTPVPSSSVQFARRWIIRALRFPVFAPSGGMMISSPCALISMRKSPLSLQSWRN